MEGGINPTIFHILFVFFSQHKYARYYFDIFLSDVQKQIETKKLSKLAIAGIVAGAVGAICVTISGIAFFFARHKFRRI